MPWSAALCFLLISICAGPRIFSFFLFSFLVALFSLGMRDIVARRRPAPGLLFLFCRLFFMIYEIRFNRVFVGVGLAQFYLETLSYV